MIQERDVLQIKDEEEKLQIEEEDKDEEYTRYNTCCRGSRSISADQPFFFFLIGISRSTLTKTNGKDEEPGNQQTSKPWRERERVRVCVCVSWCFHSGRERKVTTYNNVSSTCQTCRLMGLWSPNVGGLMHA